MDRVQPRKALKVLSGYYGILQSIHFLLLTRAGWLLLQGQAIPFPASPPPGGWTPAALPFLLGMGFVDLIAIGLGLVYSYNYFWQGKINILLGLISLTAAISSGIIYLIGTVPSGAWQAHPVAYLAVLLFFSPILPFYVVLLQTKQSEEDNREKPS